MPTVSGTVGLIRDCYYRCETPEQLRSHLNNSCCMLPQISPEEEQAISGLLGIEESESKPISAPPVSVPVSSLTTSIQSSVLTTIPKEPSAIPEQPSIIPKQSSSIPEQSPSHPSSIPEQSSPHPASPTPAPNIPTQPPPQDDLDISSTELDALLHMDLNSTLPTPITEVCSICRDSADDTSNPLLRCALCGVIVHTSCYGVVSAPSPRWQCDVYMERRNKL